MLKVAENTGPAHHAWGRQHPGGCDTFDATDQDGADTARAYSVSGADREVLAFNSSGILNFKEGHEPDYEEQSSYSITITARSGQGFRRLSATLEVTIEVVDAEDAGEVVLSQREPQAGTEVHARASDPDGGVKITRCEWARSAVITVGAPSTECLEPGISVVGGWVPIGAASLSNYTPTPADVGRCLRATVTYTDTIGDAHEQVTEVAEAPVQRSKTVNAAPVFPDQDFLTEGDQSDRASRRVAENTQAGRNIGSPVRAGDDDGDLLIYTLGVVDAASFGISRKNGQLETKAPLNYEVEEQLHGGGDRHRPVGRHGQHDR